MNARHRKPGPRPLTMLLIGFASSVVASSLTLAVMGPADATTEPEDTTVVAPVPEEETPVVVEEETVEEEPAEEEPVEGDRKVFAPEPTWKCNGDYKLPKVDGLNYYFTSDEGETYYPEDRLVFFVTVEPDEGVEITGHGGKSWDPDFNHGYGPAGAWIQPERDTDRCGPRVPVTEEPKPQALPNVGSKGNALLGLYYSTLALLAGLALIQVARRPRGKHRT